MPFQFSPITPTPDDQQVAREAFIQLCGVTEYLGLQIVRRGKTELVPLPAPAFQLLRQMLDEMMEGREFAVVPVVQELSVPEAAKLMKVSRQFLADMIDRGTLQGRKVGTHRRVQLREVVHWLNLLRKRAWWQERLAQTL